MFLSIFAVLQRVSRVRRAKKRVAAARVDKEAADALAAEQEAARAEAEAEAERVRVEEERIAAKAAEAARQALRHEAATVIQAAVRGMVERSAVMAMVEALETSTAGSANSLSRRYVMRGEDGTFKVVEVGFGSASRPNTAPAMPGDEESGKGSATPLPPPTDGAVSDLSVGDADPGDFFSDGVVVYDGGVVSDGDVALGSGGPTAGAAPGAARGRTGLGVGAQPLDMEVHFPLGARRRNTEIYFM